MNNDDRRKRETYLISLEQEINQVLIEILKYIKIFSINDISRKERYTIKILIYNHVGQSIQLLSKIKHI